ncbi:MAG: Cof-type HAD-IIB family hydrolase [Lachnospiraceae bacterium]|nr:Cof-type HAD-IIB family hydrolase [Lachnospiraceae bacterium]
MKDKDKGLERFTSSRERSRRIRAVATDMDGSFLDGSGMVSPANQAAVEKLRKAGIRFMVCTGRSLREGSEPLKKAGISCDMIAMNGAAVYDADGVRKREYLLSMEKIQAVFHAVEAVRSQLILQLVTEQGEFILADEAVFRRFFLTRIFPPQGEGRTGEEEDRLLADFIRITPEEFFKLDVQCYKAVTLSEDTGLIRQIEGPLKAISGVCVAASFPTNWEITHENASKGEGLADYAAGLGLSLDQVMAVGDGDNDISMIGLPLGWSVAMGNGAERLKEAADIVTRSNREDGFAAAVDALLAARDGEGGEPPEERVPLEDGEPLRK